MEHPIHHIPDSDYNPNPIENHNSLQINPDESMLKLTIGLLLVILSISGNFMRWFYTGSHTVSILLPYMQFLFSGIGGIMILANFYDRFKKQIKNVTLAISVPIKLVVIYFKKILKWLKRN